jgi:hypothetical protein
MSTTMVVPVAIAPDALAFINQLGQRDEFERMIERAKQVVPGLASIEVAFDEATDEMPPGVILWTHRDDVGIDDDPTQRSWIEWMAATFPPEVYRATRAWPPNAHGVRFASIRSGRISNCSNATRGFSFASCREMMTILAAR